MCVGGGRDGRKREGRLDKWKQQECFQGKGSEMFVETRWKELALCLSLGLSLRRGRYAFVTVEKKGG